MSANQELSQLICDTLSINQCGETGALARARKVALGIKDYHVTDTEILYRSFDRSKPFDPVPADRCLLGVSALCGVRAVIFQRKETSLFGHFTKRRLLAIFGPEIHILFAERLYFLLEDTISWSSQTRRVPPISVAHYLNTELLKLAATIDLGIDITGDKVAKAAARAGVRFSAHQSMRV